MPILAPVGPADPGHAGSAVGDGLVKNPMASDEDDPESPQAGKSAARAEIEAIYGLHNPSKLHTVEKLANKYGEDRLLLMMRTKYGDAAGGAMLPQPIHAPLAQLEPISVTAPTDDEATDDEYPYGAEIPSSTAAGLSQIACFEDEPTSDHRRGGDKEDSSEEDDTGEDPYGTVWQAADIETAVGDPTWASQHSVKIRSLKWRVDRHERKLNDIINSGVIEAGVPKDGSPKALGDDTLVSFLARMPIFVNGITLGTVTNTHVHSFAEIIAPKLQRRKFYQNTMVITKGAEANEMFFISSGAADVFIELPDDDAANKIPPVATLKSGTCFGEAALISSHVQTRNAWIRAKFDMDVYVLTGVDFREALREVPQMQALFTEKTNRDTEDRAEHLKRYQDGGGNFKKGFRVKLKNMDKENDVRRSIMDTLDNAFDQIPDTFPRHAVETLLQSKIEEIVDLQEKLSYDPGHEEDQTGPPMTQREQKVAFVKMGMTAFAFFTVCFIPFMAEQHHAEPVLVASIDGDPGVIELTHYSEYRLEVVGRVAAWPHNGIHESAPEHEHRRRRMQQRDPNDGGSRHPRPPPPPRSESHEQNHRPSPESAGEHVLPTEMSYESLTITPLVIRASEHIVEEIANGLVNLTHAEHVTRDIVVLDREKPMMLADREREMRLDFDMHKLLAAAHFDSYSGSHGDQKIYLLVTTTSQVPVPLSIVIHDLGALGVVQEIVAIFILIGVFAMIVFEVIHHALVAMFGSYLVLLCLAIQHRMPSIEEVVMQMDHGTLALLWGMMIIVGVTSKTGIFEWCAVRLYEQSGGQPFKLLVLVSFFDIVLSAFLDNVTTMLLLAPVCVQLCAAVKMDPRPFLMALACFGNIGGTATMIGDPPNIIIGNMLSEYVTFNDFIVFLGSGVLLCLGPSFVFTKWFYRDQEGWDGTLSADVEQLKRDNPIKNMRLLIKTGIMLSSVIVGFFLHPVSHIDPTFVAIAGAIAVFLLDDPHDVESALHKVEWDTLIFFAALFVLVEGLGEMGLLRMIASAISDLVETFEPESRQAMAIILVSCVSAITSAFIDNIPFTTCGITASTMVPVIRVIAEDVEGINLEPLIWSLAYGSCLGGMGTLIGASDNVVMAGIAEKAGFHVSFIEFMKLGFPLMVICVTISTTWLLILHSAGVWPTGL